MADAGRRGRAFAAAEAAGIDALLLTHPPDIRYLSGFTGSSAVLVLARRRSVLFTDGRYTTQARSECKGTRVVISKRPALLEACAHIEKIGVKRCGFDSDHTTVSALDQMRKAVSAPLRRSFFQPAPAIVAKLRESKDAGEIARMRSAAELGCRIFDSLFDHIVSGVTEAEIALAIESAARRAGASAMSFETIVAGGPRSALPHGVATSARLPRRGFVTLDFGVVLDGYCSDMTRTVHLGRPSPEERAVYDAVLGAQLAAVSRVAPGVSGAEVDQAARAPLQRAGFGRCFTHSTGHGVGLEIHEGPRLAANVQEKLRPGMVITVEPGVYLPGRFGVRIEDMVLVTEQASELLTLSTKALIEL